MGQTCCTAESDRPASAEDKSRRSNPASYRPGNERPPASTLQSVPGDAAGGTQPASQQRPNQPIGSTPSAPGAPSSPGQTAIASTQPAEAPSDAAAQAASQPANQQHTQAADHAAGSGGDAVTTADSTQRSPQEWFALQNGDQYQGEWRDSTIHGHGIYRYAASGFQYEGEFVDHERHGYGVFTYETRNHRYEGYWMRGQRHGKGSYRMTDYSHYIGEFRDDLMCGRGKWQSAPGSGGDASSEFYHGEWLEGSKHGWGVNVEVQDGQYAGQFLHGDRSGEGYHYIRTDGPAGAGTAVTVYVGHFAEDAYTGPGVTWKIFATPGVTPQRAAEMRAAAGNNSLADGVIHAVHVGTYSGGIMDGYGTLFVNQSAAPAGAAAGGSAASVGGMTRFVGRWHENSVSGGGMLFLQDGSALYSSEWMAVQPDVSLALSDIGLVREYAASEVSTARSAVFAAGGYASFETAGGDGGPSAADICAEAAASEGRLRVPWFAPSFAIPDDSDPIMLCLGDPAIQRSLRTAYRMTGEGNLRGIAVATMRKDGSVVHQMHEQIMALSESVRAVALSPFAFAVEDPPDVPDLPSALKAADTELRANPDGLPDDFPVRTEGRGSC
eukprot:TRINITY_DN12096_c0_g1_i1.p1 TRINITY_DN12096_c0_g1~~TRINITY_DN12096_c0_g1_i1.p1  ORF type:complete len:610 (+),score=96.66 TRINITY_DN12096_c0_g1_i1:204-2033(+)